MSIRPLVLLLAAGLGAPFTQAAPRREREVPKVLAVSSGRQYRDYYGSALSRDAKALRAGDLSFRWGVVNPKPLEMCCFGGTFLSDARHTRRFRTILFADARVKMPLVFTFRADDRNGTVLETVTLAPGGTREVDIALEGERALFFSTDLKIGHDKAERILLGEPRFE